MAEQIVEVKKNQTGTGFLFENDGYMSIHSEDNKVLKESIDNFNNGVAHELPNPFVVSAVFQKYGVENANGRIYPEEILKREVVKFQQKIKDKMALCECEHPNDTNINLERVCASIIEVHWVGRTLVGKLEIPISEGFRRFGICSTLADRIAQWLISGLRIGVSSRAIGNVQQVGGSLVVDDTLSLITFDVVSTPSTPGAMIDLEEKNLSRYVESKEENTENKQIITENKDKYSKFDKWLFS